MSKMNPAPHAPVAEPMPEPMVMTPRMAPRWRPGKRSATVLGVGSFLAIVGTIFTGTISDYMGRERADHADDGDAVGEDGRALAADVVGDGAREDGPHDGEEAAHAQHGRRIELVESHVHGKGELMKGDEEAAKSRAEIDGEEEPEVRRAYGILHRPVAARVGHQVGTLGGRSRAPRRFGVRAPEKGGQGQDEH